MVDRCIVKVCNNSIHILLILTVVFNTHMSIGLMYNTKHPIQHDYLPISEERTQPIMYKQLTIATYLNAIGIRVTVRSGLNERNKWELQLDVPRDLSDIYYGRSSANLRYTERNGMYFAEDARSGRVSYFYWDGKPNGRGFGGAKYELTMVDGSTRVLEGPWSSNSCAMNKEGFKPSMEVTIHCLYNMADAMTVEEINRLLLPLDMECILIDGYQPWIIRL